MLLPLKSPSPAYCVINRPILHRCSCSLHHTTVCEPLLKVPNKFMQSDFLYMCLSSIASTSVGGRYVYYAWWHTLLTVASNAADVGTLVNIFWCPFISRKNNYVSPRDTYHTNDAVCFTVTTPRSQNANNNGTLPMTYASRRTPVIKHPDNIVCVMNTSIS